MGLILQSISILMRADYMSVFPRNSQLLSSEENDLVSRLLGNRCQSLASAVVQVFLADSIEYGWRKHDAGVLCFVKDNFRRSYFFRLYCLTRKHMVWEHEVYNNFDYNAPKPFLHWFEGEDCVVAFNFAHEEEARIILNVLLEKLEARKQRKEQRRSRSSTQHPFQQPSIVPENTQLANGVLPLPTRQKHVPIGSSKRKEKDSKRRLTKADISGPKDFRHLMHVGWDPNKGFDLDNVDDPQLKQFFKKAGVSDRQLQDRETREFIYDFINRHGGLDAVKEDAVKEEVTPKPQPAPTHVVPPPVPARSTPANVQIQTRSAPPPPPSRIGPLPPPPPPSQPPNQPKIQSKVPQTLEHSVPVPPPAPPPPPLPPPAPAPLDVQPPSPPSNPPVHHAGPDPRSALMDAIRSGKALKHVEVESKKSSGSSSDTRGDLLDQIRQGVELKSVQPIQRQAEDPQNSLAGALARALAERAKFIHSDSSEDEDENDEEEDDEWED